MKIPKTATDKEIWEIIKQYDVRVHRDVEEDGTETYYAYYCDIGAAPCSCAAETANEAMYNLKDVAFDVFTTHRDNGWEIPPPTKSPFFMSAKELDEWVETTK